MTRVTIKFTEKMVGDADVCIINANTIQVENGLIMVKQIEDSLDPLDDFMAHREEIVGIFRCDDVRAIYRTVSK